MNFITRRLGKNGIKKGVSLRHESIRTLELMEIGLKNLFYKRLRTTLTIIGVMIGVGAVLFLLAFGFGLRDVVRSQVVDSNSIRTVDVSSIKSQLIKLDSAAVHQIQSMQNVDTVAKIYNQAGKTSYSNSKVETVLYGVDQSYLDLMNYKKLAGAAPHFTKTTDVLVNQAYLQAIGISDPKQIVGQPISLEYKLKNLAEANQDDTQKMTGIITTVLDTGSGAEVYVSSKVFESVGAVNASQLKVLVNNKESVPEVRKKIDALGLITASPLETLDQIDQVFSFLNILFLGFGSIGLVIAILGMFNTLTISLLERTKEIGLMITLGARRRDIRRLFTIEAVSLSFLGGISGGLGAFILSRIVNLILNHFAHGRGVSDTINVFSFSPSLLLGTLGFSILLGLLVVYLPARRAATINPIEALKS